MKNTSGLKQPSRLLFPGILAVGLALGVASNAGAALAVRREYDIAKAGQEPTVVIGLIRAPVGPAATGESQR